jgi:hypothetical protein
MRLRHNVDGTIQMLTHLKSELGNVVGGEQPWHRRDSWLRWWSQADSQLRNFFTDGELAEKLYISSEKVRHVNLGALPYVLMNHETAVWLEQLEQVIMELTALKPFIERPGRIVIPDTSAFLEGAYFTELDWHVLAGAANTEPVRLVVPVLVLEELDAHKRGKDRQRDRAVSTLRRLWELGGNAPERVALIPGRAVTVEVFLDGAWHARRPVNDDEIIERALAVSEITGRQVLLAAADYSMLYRASAVGLTAAPVLRHTGDGDSAGADPFGHQTGR